jgi:hypothetical protein
LLTFAEMSAKVSKCQQMSANVSKRQQTSANVSKCQQMSANVSKCQQMSAAWLTLLYISYIPSTVLDSQSLWCVQIFYVVIFIIRVAKAFSFVTDPSWSDAKSRASNDRRERATTAESDSTNRE